MMRTYLRRWLLFLLVGLIGVSGFRAEAQEQPTPTLPPYYLEHISAVSWSPNGKLIAVGDWNGRINIVDSSGQHVRALNGHTTPIWSLAWNTTGTQLASGSLHLDPSVRIWDIASDQIIREFISVGDEIDVVRWIDNDKSIIVLPSAGDNMIFDVRTGALLSKIDTGTVYSIDWSPDGTKVAFPQIYGGIKILDSKNYQMVSTIGANSGKISGPNTNQITCVTWKPDGTTLAVGTWGGKVLIWDVKTGELTFEQRGNDYTGRDSYLSFVQGIHFNSDGSELTSVGRDGTVRTWNTTTGQQLANAKISSLVFDVDWSPDGSQIVYGGEGKTFKIVSLADLLTTPAAAQP